MLGTRKATRDAIIAWLEGRQKKAYSKTSVKEYTKAYAQGYAKGREEGIKEILAKAHAWYKRQQAAREKGEPFDEPPPWDDNS